MFFDLLHFGSGAQAANYFVLCFVGILGTIQGVATRYNRRDLLWLEGNPGYALSAVMVAGSFVWFFLTDTEAFIPGLAGGEFFTLFVSALVLAVPTTRVIAFAFMRVRSFTLTPKAAREKEPTL
jgi:hypothetical protein